MHTLPTLSSKRDLQPRNSLMAIFVLKRFLGSIEVEIGTSKQRNEEIKALNVSFIPLLA